jgi:hypothetical protein
MQRKQNGIDSRVNSKARRLWQVKFEEGVDDVQDNCGVGVMSKCRIGVSISLYLPLNPSLKFSRI